jgi:hypothetical protein
LVGGWCGGTGGGDEGEEEVGGKVKKGRRKKGGERNVSLLAPFSQNPLPSQNFRYLLVSHFFFVEMPHKVKRTLATFTEYYNGS